MAKNKCVIVISGIKSRMYAGTHLLMNYCCCCYFIAILGKKSILYRDCLPPCGLYLWNGDAINLSHTIDLFWIAFWKIKCFFLLNYRIVQLNWNNVVEYISHVCLCMRDFFSFFCLPMIEIPKHIHMHTKALETTSQAVFSFSHLSCLVIVMCFHTSIH